MTDLLNAHYMLDGVHMQLSPAQMLRECSVNAPLEPDGDPVTVADEHLDLVPVSFPFSEKDIQAYVAAVRASKPVFPLPFAGPYTTGKMAQALIDAIWMNGHFRLGDLSLKADWKWNDKSIGLAAAFYDSVEAACGYLDALGLKFSGYGLTSGQPGVTFRAGTVAEEDAVDEETSLLRELPYRTANPRISRKRKVGASILPEKADWLIYIPFDPCDFRLGGSHLASALGAAPTTPPDVSDADYFIDCYEVVRELVEDGIVKAGATVGDGGLMTCLRNMADGGTGAEISIQDICKAYGGELPVRALFSEVPGVVIQIADLDYDYVDAELILQDVVYFPIGRPVPELGAGEICLTDKVDLPQILESLMNTLEGED